MSGLLVNEVIKIISKRKFKILFLLLAGIVFLGSHTAIRNMDKEYVYDIPKSIETQLQETEGRYERIQQGGDRTKNLRYLHLAQVVQKEVELVKKQKENFLKLSEVHVDWKMVLRQDLNYLKSRKELIEEEKNVELLQEINEEILLKEHYLNHNIKYPQKRKISAFYNFPYVIHFIGRFSF